MRGPLDLGLLIFPCQSDALECSSFIQTNAQLRLNKIPKVEITQRSLSLGSLSIVHFERAVEAIAKEFWQHTGTGISSRFAQYALNEISGNPASSKDSLLLAAQGHEAKEILRRRIASFLTKQNVQSTDVYLFPSGMAAIYQAQRLIHSHFPADRKSVQFGYLPFLSQT